MVFCAKQGAGKTLSAIQYCVKTNDKYTNCIFYTNVAIKNYAVNCYYKIINLFDKITIIKYFLIETNELVRVVAVTTDESDTKTQIKKYKDIKIVIAYDGIDCIKTLSNEIEGVLYLIDEIHLEFNSLESKNVPIEIMVEVSQQRKQKKHIVGTLQVFMRLAKPLIE